MTDLRERMRQILPLVEKEDRLLCDNIPSFWKFDFGKENR